MKSGIINIYKEKDFTSFDVIAKLRGMLREKKLGHTGTLDPMAEGVLPVCIGKATKLAALLTDKPKEYVCEFCLGMTSDTQDITGTILSRSEISVDEQQILDSISSFKGLISQLTPMYSARKVDGKKLYEYARAGKEIERETKNVNIYEINDININLDQKLVSMRVLCEKGTYIRTLCHDIGQKLGCGAVMTKLLRTKVDIFNIDTAIKLSEVEQLRDEGKLDEHIISAEELFHASPSVKLSNDLEKYVFNGNPLNLDNFDEILTEGSIVKVYSSDDNFLALYRVREGKIRSEIQFF